MNRLEESTHLWRIRPPCFLSRVLLVSHFHPLSQKSSMEEKDTQACTPAATPRRPWWSKGARLNCNEIVLSYSVTYEHTSHFITFHLLWVGFNIFGIVYTLNSRLLFTCSTFPSTWNEIPNFRTVSNPLGKLNKLYNKVSTHTKKRVVYGVLSWWGKILICTYCFAAAHFI